MEFNPENHARNFATQFESLGDLDRQFLIHLSLVGGACSRKDASLVLGFPQIHQVNGLLDRLTKRKFLKRKICARIEGFPVIYFVSSALAQHLNAGWYRYDNIRTVLTRTFRFAVFVKNSQRLLWSYRSNPNNAPISTEAFRYLRNNMIDSPLDVQTKTFLLDCMPFEPIQDVIKKIASLHILEPELKFELWTPCQSHRENLISSLPDDIKPFITSCNVHEHPLYQGYAKAIEDARYSQFQFDGTDGVFGIRSHRDNRKRTS